VISIKGIWTLLEGLEGLKPCLLHQRIFISQHLFVVLLDHIRSKNLSSISQDLIHTISMLSADLIFNGVTVIFILRRALGSTTINDLTCQGFTLLSKLYSKHRVGGIVQLLLFLLE